MRILNGLVSAFAVILGSVSVARAADNASAPRYNRDIRPILAENCFQCHGPDSASRQAELRLDRRDAAIDMESIVPGKPEESELLRRVKSSDPDEIMPPPSSHKKITSQQKELLERWIAAGAEYEPHWALIAPTKPPLPAVKNSDWCRNAIDRFVLAALESQHLQPAPEADRRTLGRRLSLDLTGLPPDPAAVETFVNDSAPDAYERYVDRLLESPQWGEHRARYWLDAARYADTHGIHFDNFREMWSYRDWVVNAFNRNVPFDQFTIEQLAGDLLPDHTLEQQIASGFNRCNITTNEGGIIDEEYRVLYARDRTETTSQVWLGLTAQCAVCHDHKFDPISQREFYSLSAYFNNTTQAVRDGNVKDTPPIVVVPPPEDRDRWNSLVTEAEQVNGKISKRKVSARDDFQKWQPADEGASFAGKIPEKGLRFNAALAEGTGGELTCSVDGQSRTLKLVKEPAWDAGHVGEKAFKTASGETIELADAGNFDREQPFSCGTWLRIATDDEADQKRGAILARMDDRDGKYRGWDLWLENGRLGMHLIHEWPGNAIKVLTNSQLLKAGVWNHVFVTYDGKSNLRGIKVYINGKSQTTTSEIKNLKGTIRTDVPLKIAQREDKSALKDALLQDVRIYDRELKAEEVGQIVLTTRAAWLAHKPAQERTKAEQEELFSWWLPNLDKEYLELANHKAEVEKAQNEVRARGTIAHVMKERDEPANAYVLIRGEYEKRGDEVTPNTPAALPEMPAELPRNRLGFAQWLLRPEHPLTARVTVNRYWQEVFGTGLVRTAGDFGVTGELPSHPELLDWMAVDFRESGWDIKRFFRQLVTSATYRQSAVTTPEKLEKDPANRLLSRGPRFRMDAEMVRDYALAASGLLVREIGGPSVKPYQPEGVWEAVAMTQSNTRNYQPDEGANLYRRSVYTFWKRAAPPASMDIFNAPSREICTVRRERTNTPLQALVTMNDPQFIEAARHLAQTALQRDDQSTDARLDWLVGRILVRPLRTEERSVVQKSLADLLDFYKSHADQAKELIVVGDSKPDSKLDPAMLAGWTMLANQLLNLDEVLNK